MYYYGSYFAENKSDLILGIVQTHTSTPEHNTLIRKTVTLPAGKRSLRALRALPAKTIERLAHFL